MKYSHWLQIPLNKRMNYYCKHCFYLIKISGIKFTNNFKIACDWLKRYPWYWSILSMENLRTVYRARIYHDDWFHTVKTERVGNGAQWTGRSLRRLVNPANTTGMLHVREELFETLLSRSTLQEWYIVYKIQWMRLELTWSILRKWWTEYG